MASHLFTLNFTGSYFMFTSSSLLGKAQTALLQSYWNASTPKPAGLHPPEAKGNIHWSFYLLGLGTLAAAVAAIAGAIISQLGLIFGGIYYALTTGIGAYYVQRFGSEQTFEKYVQILTERVREVTQDVQKLANENAHLHTELTALSHEISTSQQILNENAQALRKESDEIGKHTWNLEQKAPLADKFLSLIDLYKKENGNLEVKLDGLNKQTQQLKAAKEGLEDRVSTLSQQNQKLESQVKTYTQSNAIYHEENLKLQTLIHDLKIQLKNTSAISPKPSPSPISKTPDKDTGINTTLHKIEQNGQQLNSQLDEAEKILKALVKSTNQ